MLAVSLARMGTRALIVADTSSYLIPGRNLLLHGRFAADGVPDLLRTPGYSLFLAITSVADLPAAAVVNVILSVISVILVWKLGRAVFTDPNIALGAAWLFAFEPGSVSSSVILMSESLFLVFFLLSMERLTEFLRGRRLPVLAVAGLWLAAATYVRPVTYFLPVALALGLFLVLRRVPGLRWKAPAVLLISVMPWLAAWQIRNWVETGYRGFSSVREANLYFLVAADVTVRIEHRRWVSAELGYGDFTNNSGQTYLFQPYLALHPEQAQWNQAQRLAYLHSEAMRIIQAHFGVYMRSCLVGGFKILSFPATYNLARPVDQKPLTYAEAITENSPAGWRFKIARIWPNPWQVVEHAIFGLLLLGLYLFAARGLFCGGVHAACLWLLLGTSLYFLAVSAAMMGPLPQTRLRLPVMPLVCILAAAGFRRTKTI
jgi:hypothetical protein